MWSAIPLKYRIIAIAALSLIIVTFCFFWVRDYNESLRLEGRKEANAEWNAKEAERQKLINTANENALKSKNKNTEKVKVMADPDVIDELDANGWLRPD